MADGTINGGTKSSWSSCGLGRQKAFTYIRGGPQNHKSINTVQFCKARQHLESAGAEHELFLSVRFV